MSKVAIKILEEHKALLKAEALRLKDEFEVSKRNIKALETQIFNLVSDVALIDESIERLKGTTNGKIKSKKIK